MKKALIAAFGGLALLVAAALAVPIFIDLNDYRDEIGNQFETATGRRLSIDGQIELSLLPLPTVTISGIRIANAPNGTAEDMVRLESAEVRVALLPLFRGSVQVDRVTLVAPVIEIERFADGSGNWTLATAPDNGEQTLPTDDEGELDLSFDDVAIEDGTVIYRQPNLEERIGGIDVRASAASFTGPFDIEGALVVRGDPVRFAAEISSIAETETSFSATVESEPGELSVAIAGSAILAGDEPRFSGQLEVEGKSIATAVETVTGEAAEPLLDVPTAIVGNIAASLTGVDITELHVSIGPASGEGNITARFDGVPTVNAALAFQNVDFDPILTHFQELEPVETESSDREGETATAELPEGLGVYLDFHIANALVNRAQVQDVRIAAALEEGVLNLQQMSARMPGEAHISLIGFVETEEGVPRFSGQADFSAADGRTFASWLGLDLTTVPEDALRAVDFSAEIDAMPESLTLSRINVGADSSRLTGNLDLSLDGRPKLVVNAAIGRIDVDAYLPPSEGSGEERGAEDDSTPMDVFDLTDANMTLSVGEIIYRRATISNVDLDMQLRDGVVNIENLSAGNFAGIGAQIRGHLDPSGRKGAVSFDLASDDLSALFQFADYDPPIPAESFGSFQAIGQVSGDVSSLNVDGKVTVANVESLIKGSISGLDSLPKVDLRFDADTPTGLQVLRRLGFGTAVPEEVKDGPASVGATIVGDLDSAVVTAEVSFNELVATVDGRWDGSLPNPSVDATVTAHAPSHVRFGQVFAPESPLANAVKDGPLSLGGKIRGNPLSAETSLTLGVAGALISVTGDVANPLLDPVYELALQATHDDFAALMATFGGVDRDLGALNVTAQASGQLSGPTDKPHAAVFEATLGPTVLSGEVNVHTADPRPVVNAVITAQDIVLDPYLAAAGSGDAQTVKASAVGGASTMAGEVAQGERWSREPLDLAVFQEIDGNFTFKANSVRLQDHRIESVIANGSLADGTLTVDRFGGQMNDGRVNFSGKLASSPSADADLSMTADGVNIGPLIPKIADLVTVTGTANLSGTFTSRGESVFELVSNLGGNGFLNVRDGVIGGIDIPTINRQLGDLDSEASYVRLLGTAAVGGQTRYSEIAGTFTAVNGVLTSNDLHAALDGAKATATVRADLPNWLLDANGEARLLGHESAPGIGARFEGALDSPRMTLQTDALKVHVGGKAVKSIIKKVDPDLLDSDAGQLLNAIIGGGSGGADTSDTSESPPQTRDPPPSDSEPPSDSQRPVERLLRGLFK